MKGAAVPMSEIVLFNEGKAKCLLYFDKATGEVKATYKKTALLNYKLMRWMVNEYNNRRKTDIKSKLVNYGRQNTEMKTVQGKDTLRSDDLLMVNVRYHGQDQPKSLSQVEFTKLMMQRPSSKVWNDISYIQNYVTISRFLPENFIYSYYAPVDKENPKLTIDYSAVEGESEGGLNAQALKLCNTIGGYISKMHGIVSA
eukprot:TRINITY_DN12119_c0_g1_i2.p1 TRINITY_DN12119_c0_g1~~TRINITY_DN12119_c0_g1_i2.p1  ORF type:complete len:199 (-),score=38.38 TRINITY_DN12119_c0_g1_i2:916-1512(-)